MTASYTKPQFSKNTRSQFYNTGANSSTYRGRGRSISSHRTGGRTYGRNNAQFYSGQNNNNNRFNNFSSKQFQGSNSSDYSYAACRICGKGGHTALDCYHRMDHSYQGKQPPTKLTAKTAAYTNPSSDPNYWITDTGATNHITSDLASLSLSTEYQGAENITIGAGTSTADASHRTTASSV
ncbi:hypothetical protein F0562_034103 [Nyssa sinensis]|uniref:CCHC-type domain-containing protein n=1 Tax=Nyssa sinensis TaxID=561372 RepID=A0A5J5AFV7_9ASTE|nr:hypothetical protein F0562_034103 [Nyssa sinensis]